MNDLKQVLVENMDTISNIKELMVLILSNISSDIDELRLVSKDFNRATDALFLMRLKNLLDIPTIKYLNNRKSYYHILHSLEQSDYYSLVILPPTGLYHRELCQLEERLIWATKWKEKTMFNILLRRISAKYANFSSFCTYSYYNKIYNFIGKDKIKFKFFELIPRIEKFKLLINRQITTEMNKIINITLNSDHINNVDYELLLEMAIICERVDAIEYYMKKGLYITTSRRDYLIRLGEKYREVTKIMSLYKQYILYKPNNNL